MSKSLFVPCLALIFFTLLRFTPLNDCLKKKKLVRHCSTKDFFHLFQSEGNERIILWTLNNSYRFWHINQCMQVCTNFALFFFLHFRIGVSFQVILVKCKNFLNLWIALWEFWVEQELVWKGGELKGSCSNAPVK